MKKVLFRAPVLTMSGYGVHARQVFRWLNGKKNIQLWVQALNWGNTPWMVERSMQNGLVGKVMDRTAPYPKDLDISFQLQLPNEWDPNLAKINIGMTAGVETDKCNVKWVEAINSMDMVIVPSEHAKQTFLNSGLVMKPVHVVPEAFIDEIKEEPDGLDLDFDTDFNFLVFGQLTGNNDATDRKNTYQTLKWLCETFRKDDDVGIVLKTNSGRNNRYDFHRTTKMIEETLRQIRKGDGPPVYLLHGSMNNDEVARLYRHPKIKALVSLTRGEGFGLPILEAAASGLPVIATDWSGHLDFMNKGKFVKIGYDLKPLDQSKIDDNIFVNGARWANPREKSTKNALKKFKQMPDEPMKWAQELSETIREEYSQESIEEKYDKILSEAISEW
jgi:glycosyltransferase involved in cell wall biosynthesis